MEKSTCAETTTATLKAVLENPQRIIEKDLKKKIKRAFNARTQ